MLERTSGFTVGGAVPLNDASYVYRTFESDLFEAVTAGTWAVLLGPRQHGKTSALTRLFVSLEDSGYKCALVDLQAYGANGSYEELLFWLSSRIARDVDSEPVGNAESDDLESVLHTTLPTSLANVVIILDEVSAVPPALRQRFFGQLRALFNMRGRNERDHLSWRVNFVFAGTFRPEQMIEGENSPFNISRFVSTTDFTEEQIHELIDAVDAGSLHAIVDPIYACVGGQPYLVQLLLAGAERLSSGGATDLVQPTVDHLLSGDDRHLANLLRQVRGDPGLMNLLPRILADDLDFDGHDDNQYFARTLGIAASREGKLVPRNALYSDVLIHLPGGTPAEACPDGEAELSCDVLLVTANELETNVTREVFAGAPEDTIVGKTNSYAKLGSHGGSSTMLVRCPTMGAMGPGAAQPVVSDAIAELKPSVVVLLGVAFGFWPDDQPIGTVVVADRVTAYEQAKIATEADGRERHIARGMQFNLDTRIHGRLQELVTAQRHEQAEFGTILSGEKLIDNLAFRERLREQEPEARGGEMEAAGVCAVAERARIPWVVVKGICDYADGHKGTKKDLNQKLAADGAAEFVRKSLESGVFSHR